MNHTDLTPDQRRVLENIGAARPNLEGVSSAMVPAHFVALLSERFIEPHENGVTWRLTSRGRAAVGLPTAADINAAVRAKIIEMLGCVGRANIARNIAEDGLVDMVDALFAEINDLDSKVQRMPNLRQRIRELEDSVALGADAQRTIAQLNQRIIDITLQADGAKAQALMSSERAERYLAAIRGWARDNETQVFHLRNWLDIEAKK